MDRLNKKNNRQQGLKIIFVASWPPKQCGIATFTSDLKEAILKYDATSLAYVVAINDIRKKYEHDSVVKCEIDQEDLNSLDKAARYINESGADVVSIQHEFGIWGGFDGEFIKYFLKKIKRPIVTTLHSVTSVRRGENKIRLIKLMTKNSRKIIVTMKDVKEQLHSKYKISRNKIEVIPHGAPNIEFVNINEIKRELGLSGRKIISTFGLINPYKGLEFVIEAMPKILMKHPNVIYQILGKPHPVILSSQKYYTDLQELVKKLKLKNHVIFVNKYFKTEEIIKYLQASDIYIIPYPAIEQVSSGTLAYAMAAGKCIVSTPFAYANELLNNRGGVFVEIRNSTSIAEKINYLFDHPKEIKKRGELAYEYSQTFTWAKVAEKYIEVFNKAAA